MSTLPSHVVAALGLAPVFFGSEVPKRAWWLGIAVSVLPDLDVLAFRFGVPYSHPLGHRGFSHSLLAAFLVAFLAVALDRRRDAGRWRIGVYLFVAMMSHGVLDAMTTGGKGVGFFVPFSNERYFFPWRPIRVSPFGWRPFFTSRGLAVLVSELKWVWLPAIGLAGLGWWLHWTRDRTRSRSYA